MKKRIDANSYLAIIKCLPIEVQRVRNHPVMAMVRNTWNNLAKDNILNECSVSVRKNRLSFWHGWKIKNQIIF